MTDAVFDFKTIAAAARLRALDGFNQNETPATGWAATEAALAELEAVEMPCDVNIHPYPQDSEYFYGAGLQPSRAHGPIGVVWPSFTAPDQDGA